MAISTPEENCEGLTDCEPLLMVMEHTETCAREDYVINVSGDVMTSSSGFGGGCPPNTHVSLIEDGASNGTHVPNSQESSSSSGSSDSNNSTLIRRNDGYGHRNRSPLNSGPWISVELFVTLSQIIAAIIVLLLSRDEKTQSPLFVWIVGYTAGCIATLPLLYWRNLHRNDQENVQESIRNQGSSHNVSASENNSYTVISIPEMLEEQQHRTSTSLTEESRLRFNALVDHFKMALDCFFAVWFVVGNVWIFGGHSSSSDAPNLYRLCIVFLTFSCIGYAMPFILCATICCCLPCLMSLLGYGEDMNQTRGATPEVINALPTYRFQAKKNGTICESEISLDGEQQGGILGHGTEKERLISADDAVCCICLAAYIDNDELRELPCAHCFHMDCVDKWLKINATCPLCKYEVETAIPGVASDQNQDENRVRNTSVLESTELR